MVAPGGGIFQPQPIELPAHLPRTNPPVASIEVEKEGLGGKKEQDAKQQGEMGHKQPGFSIGRMAEEPSMGQAEEEVKERGRQPLTGHRVRGGCRERKPLEKKRVGNAEQEGGGSELGCGAEGTGEEQEGRDGTGGKWDRGWRERGLG